MTRDQTTLKPTDGMGNNRKNDYVLNFKSEQAKTQLNQNYMSSQEF